MPLAIAPFGFELAPFRLRQQACLDQPRHVAEEELRRPVPERRARPDEPRQRDQVNEAEAGLRDQLRKAAPDVQVPSGAPPTLLDRCQHPIERRAARLQRRRAVVQVVPHHEPAAGPQPLHDVLDQRRRIGQEAEEPAHERAVQRGGLQPQLFDPLHPRRELFEPAPLRFPDQSGDEARGLVDGQHAALGADAIRQFEGGESRAAAEVEQARPRSEPGAVPQVARRLGPQAVLRLEAPRFLGIGAEQIRIFECGLCHSGLSPRIVIRQYSDGTAPPGSAAATACSRRRTPAR